MSDINLPGISSNIDVKGIIEKLVKVESKKLDKFEKSKELFDKQKSAWSTLGNKIKAVQDAARSLYSFRSPFDDKIAHSSAEDFLTATAARTAEPAKASVKIKQAAQRERIVTDPVDNTTVFNGQTLKLKIGDADIDVVFNGGRIENLSDALNGQAGDYLTSKITHDTDKTSVLVVETHKTGKNNTIASDDPQTLQFLKSIGLFEEKTGIGYDTRFTSERLTRADQKTKFALTDNRLSLEPEGKVEFSLGREVAVRPSIMVKVRMKAVELPRKEEAQAPHVFPKLNNIGKVTVKDIDIIGGNPVSGIETEKQEKPKPAEVVDNTVLAFKNTDGVVHEIAVGGLGADEKEYSYRLSDIATEGEKITSVLMVNKNTGRRIEYADLKIVDESARPGISPKHLIQKAQDAVVYIDGVKVQREGNQIDDAIKGVTLDIKGKTDREIDLVIDRDYEKITNQIIQLMKGYNELLEYINKQSKVIPGESLKDKTEAGVLTGDITVMGLKNKLQNIMMNPYPTKKGKELSLLAQIGISMGAVNSDWNDIKGGYLQVDEDTFVESFNKYPEAIKELFGADTNNDAVIDNGVAFTLEKTLKGYTNTTNGIVAYRVKATDGRIKDEEKKIDDWNVHLEDYRKKLEKDFTLMQQSLNELDQNQKRIENFSNQFKTK